MKNFSLHSHILGNIEAVAVVGVDADSNAWHSDLRPGDIITSVNQQKVATIEALKKAVAKSNKEILLNILRGSNAIFLVINKEEQN